jgi:hypothetical protein
MLLIYRDEARFGNGRTSGQHSLAYVDFARSMAEAGILISGYRLQPSASTVRVVNDKAKAADGHYAETEEQLGGLYVIDVADLDEALKWAARCPGASQGTIEVRPIWE